MNKESRYKADYSLAYLRARSRELVRNDPQIGGALDTLVSNYVGIGISPRWQLEDSELKQELQRLWADWEGALLDIIMILAKKSIRR